jgi:hypothetical protein
MDSPHAAAEDGANEEETHIIQQSTAKRSSNLHLLAQFTEVQKAALAATHNQGTVMEGSESSSDESDDSGFGAGKPRVECTQFSSSG